MNRRQCPSSIVLVILAIATMFSSGEYCFAQNSGKPEMSSGSFDARQALANKTAPTGVLYLDDINILAGTTRYKMPASYAPYWPKKSEIGPIQKWQALTFVFWVPSLGPFTKKTMPPMVNPMAQEPGAATIGEGEFGAYVYSLQFHPNTEKGWIPPTTRAQNVIRAGSGLVSSRSHFGLEELILNQNNLGVRWFTNRTGTTPQVLFQCSDAPELLPNPICSGHAFYPDDQLAIDMWIPYGKFRHCLTAVDGARSLANEWRQRAINSK